MGRLRLAKLPYLVVLFLYIGRLVAIVHSQNEITQQDGGGVVNSRCSHLNSKRNCFPDDTEFDKLSSLLSKTDSISETSDILSDLPSSVPVTFAPPALDFKEQSVGMPVLYTVTLTNPTNSLTLQLISISGTLPDFHSSFFIDKVLRPGETTSFDVMFLPRVPGDLEDIIIIHSSLGIFEYKVRGVGVASLFRLRSLRGARIPLNATYQPLISIYNPFTVPLQIVEVYSSSQFIHIEMLSGSDEGNKTAWGIRPFETKTIARVNFHGESIDNFTSFIRIKSDHTSEPSIVLPFEVEVCQAHGLFLSREYLDFGVVRTGAETKLWLYMLNAGPYTVELKSMTLPDDLPIVVNFTNISLKPGLKYIRVASLSFFVNSTTPGGKSTGIIKIWGEDHTSFYHVQVPYEAHIMKGSLDYDADAMLFPVDAPPFYPIIRNLTLTNLFEDPVVIYSARLSSKVQNWFNILSFSSPYVLPPDGSPHTVLVLKFKAQSSDCLFNTTLRLSTNMSFFNIPLQCYDGRLDYTFEDTDTDALEFGVLTDQERVNKIFTITNNNPVKVAINSITVQEGSNIPGVSVDAILFPPHEPKTRTPPILMEGLRRGRYPPQHVLKPGQFVIYRVNVTCPKRAGSYTGEILIHSSLGKVTPVPINYVAVKGELTFIPKLIKFLPSYPCLCSVIRLSVKNSFTKPVKLVSLVLESVNNSSLPMRLPDTLPVLKPSTTTLIGEVKLDPFSVFDKKKLTKINLNCTSLMSGQRVKNDYSLIREYAHLNSLWSVWADLLRQSSSLLINFNIQLFYNVTMATATDRQEVTSARGEGPLVWPRIASSHTVSFPLTLIGNYTEMKLLLRNPSPHPLYIRPLLLSSSGQYDSSHKLLPLLSEIYKLKPFASNFSKNSFSILRPEPIKGPVLDPLDLILPPRGTGTLTIRYNPIQEYNNNNNDNDVLLLKNNLTVLDPVVLKGSSSRGFITIDGVHPSNGNRGGALLFEFSQSMLEGYINGMECGMSTTDLLTHWKLFHVRNSGPAPITINRISIGPNGGCQGNGFKVSNCRKQFIIYPNKTRNIEISCSPDFTVSRISSSLVLHSSKGSQIEFLLSALLPHHMLSLCYMATPPSDLEYMTAYLSVPLWILALLIMIIVTVLQVKWHTSKLLQPVVARETLVVKDVPIQPTGGKLFSFSDIKKLTSNISLPIATPTQHQSVKGPIENVISFSTSSSVSSLSISSTISPVTLSPLSTATSSTLPSSTVPSSSVPSSSVPSSSVLSVHYSSKQDQSVTDYETGMRHQTTTAAAVTCADKPDRTSSTNSRPHPPEPNVKKVKPIQRKSSRSVTSERGVAPLDDKADELLVRKESDESLPNSDDTSSGGSVSGSVGGASEDFSPVEEHPGAKKKNKPHPQLPKPQSSKPHPSYTKEPLTGQTIEVKEEPQTDEDLTTPTTELTTPPHLIKAVKSKKKQKQLKKEDKLTRRRQREPPTVTNNSNTIVTNNSNSVSSNSSSIVTNNSNGTGLRSKRFHGSQESLDKESVASNSTNSTDNNDEEQTPPTQEEAVPSQVETKELEQLHNDPIATDARGGFVSEEPIPVKDIDPPPPLDPVLEVEPIPKESSPKPRPQKLELSQEGGAEDIKSAESGPSSVETDGIMRGEREGGAVNNNNEKQQRKDPHQLAASLLQTNKEKIIVRRVVSNEEGGEKGSKRTEAVVTSPSKERKKHSTGGEEKRYNPSPSSLSHDATPFYPGFNPHHHQFPHHIPLGRPHLPQPRPPPPHHIPPPYDYPPPPGPHMHYHPISEEGPYPPPDSRHYESVMNRKHVKHSKQFHLPLPAGGTPPGVTPPPPYYGPGPYREMTPPHIYDERMRPHPPMDHYYDVDYYHGMKHRSEMGRGPPGAPPPGWRPKRTSFESPPISHLKPGPDEYEHAHVSAYEEQPLMRSSSRFHGYHHMENIDPTPHHDSYSISRLREGGVVPSYPVHHDDMKLLANKRLTDGGVAKMGGSNSGTSLSLLLSQSSSSGWSSSLNRAPGTIPSNNQYSKIPSTQYGGERNWMIDENEKDVLTRFSPDSSDTSTCQRLWSLNSPLSNALEEQRLQTATQLAAAPSPSPPPPLFPPSGDNYDPFDNSLSSIWSFGNRGNANRGGTLLWDTESDD